MSSSYSQLLDATILHLEDMKARGIQFVSVSSAALSDLKKSAQHPAHKKSPLPGFAASPAVNPLGASIRTLSSAVAVPAENVESKKSAAPSDLNFKDAGAIVAPPLDPAAKTAAFAELRQRAMACLKCEHLATSRKNVAFGVGNTNAELMFVGEAPGADEDVQGEPFVGRAGQLLTKIIETMGLTRDSVYIANILKCRPDTPGQPTGNRKPTLEEMQTCIPFLHEQIDLIQPKVIVALGGTAVEGLLGKTAGITRLRGTWQSYRNIPLMPTYHPAYLLRNQGPMEKRRVWEDMLQVMEKLGMAISEKQRNFFNKGA